jgi:hypothetical protein
MILRIFYVQHNDDYCNEFFIEFGTVGEFTDSRALCGWLLKPLLAAAAAVRAAPLESAASRLSSRWVVAVVPLLTILATPIVATFVLVLVMAAAPVAEMAAAATPSVVVFEAALVAVAVAAGVLVSQSTIGI